MKLQTIPYPKYEDKLPQTGQHILAQYDKNNIVVYQAYNNQIADFALTEQYLGGPEYSYSRMSWIKPNFLWMMYRCGWGSKPNQERVLALWISQSDFDTILSNAVFSSFREDKYESHQIWRDQVDSGDVRLQWDPDHDPYGQKLSRRAVQIGLRGKSLDIFGKGSIKAIEDISDFVKAQQIHVLAKNLSLLETPFESVYKPKDPVTRDRIDLDDYTAQTILVYISSTESDRFPKFQKPNRASQAKMPRK